MFIFGAGGLATDVFNVALENGDNIEGFIDESNSIDTLFDLPILSTALDYQEILIAIGDPKSRKNVVERLKPKAVKYKNIIHKHVFLSRFTSLGIGSVIMKNTAISSNVKIGSHVCIYSQCVVSHHCVIGDYCTISPGNTICGNVEIGSGCWIGAGSTIKEKVKICDNVFLGAGSLVLNDITEPGVYFGHPVKKRYK